jgi:hypothetical protein
MTLGMCDKGQKNHWLPESGLFVSPHHAERWASSLETLTLCERWLDNGKSVNADSLRYSLVSS